MKHLLRQRGGILSKNQMTGRGIVITSDKRVRTPIFRGKGLDEDFQISPETGVKQPITNKVGGIRNVPRNLQGARPLNRQRVAPPEVFKTSESFRGNGFDLGKLKDNSLKLPLNLKKAQEKRNNIRLTF